MTTILVLLSMALFVAYNIFACVKWGVLTSLSTTYYSLPNKWRCVFTLFMWAIAILLMPAWIEVANGFGDWRNNLTFLSFLTCGLICFVGAAPNFRSFEMESQVHTISATASAVTSILWCLICLWKWMYIPICAAMVPLVIAFSTKKFKYCKVYWLEMMAFAMTYISVLFCSVL